MLFLMCLLVLFLGMPYIVYIGKCHANDDRVWAESLHSVICMAQWIYYKPFKGIIPMALTPQMLPL